MSPALPREERDAIRARIEAATEAEWWATVVPTHAFTDEDYEFTRHARTDVPALLDALDAAEEEARAFFDEALRLKRKFIAARAEVSALRGRIEAGEASDGYHTHNELYDYRMLYNAHAARGWLTAGIPVVKSWHHSDGEPCFGGGWFIVTANLPTGIVSNHYRAEHWDLFADIPTVDLPPEYDGHTPADAAERLRRALAADEGEGAGR